ncbi:MAG: ATPase, T2SS/T4P/T4SS family [Candidatus Moraniibacteriota bacterium]
MFISDNHLKNFILESEIIPADALATVEKEALATKQKLGELLVAKGLMHEEQLRKTYAYLLGIPFVNLENQYVSKEILNIIPEPIARKHNIVAFEMDGRKIKVAMLDPEDLQTIDFIRKKTQSKILPCLTSEKSIRHILTQYQKSLKAEFGDLISENVKFASIKEGAAVQKPGEKEEEVLKKRAEEMPVIKIVDVLLKHAILQQASDIHIEPVEKEVIIRYRIDGILHDVMFLPKEVLSAVVARIKVLSNLKLDEHRLPQDGRFKIETSDYKFSFRVSVLPIMDGEKVVMRLLNESSKGLTLDQLGFRELALDALQRTIRRSNGMILVTGPTGSGKTTTLYTIMDILNSNTVNISTVEDPIEYRMPRINQTQVNPKIGLTFAAGLRSLLRQDPDIIMVGEIRDDETMHIAINAAMTGHLVLSTLHTNSAAATIPRLLDMGAEPFLMATTLNIAIGQRLVRKVCANCQVEQRLNKNELLELGKKVDLANLLQIMIRERIVPATVKSWEEIKFFKGKGCSRCSETGFKGRMGIYEVIEVDDDIRSLISQRKDATAIQEMALSKGVITMLQDGFIKAVQGSTTIEEVLRVTQE